MENGLFRQKSVDHISSPEALHDYMRVTSPRLWMILAAIVILLGGFIFYAATTRLESTEVIKMKVEYSSYISGYIPDGKQDVIRVGMPVRIAGKTGKISSMDNSIRYRLNVSPESTAPMAQGMYLVSIGEKNELSLTPEDTADSPLIIIYYDDNGFSADVDTNPEIIRQFAGGDVRVTFWTYEDPDRNILTGARLATVSGYETFQSVRAIVSLDNPDEPLPDGDYQAEVVTENTTPISFLWN